ncbi:MAG: ribokinase [Clostridia bacterium]|nr:ribokinase [Clostridia bacterium]
MPKVSVIGICGKSTFMYVEHFHQNGETLIADSVYEEIGGKGINQAIAAARMGAEVSFLAAIGDDDSGRQCCNVASQNGLKAFWKVKTNKNTAFAFILKDASGENRVTEFKSAQLCESDVLDFEAEIASSDILLLQQEVSPEVNKAAVALSQKHHVKVILNPAPIREITDDVARGIFAVTPNEHEKQAIDVQRFENCITTLGSKGCLINEQVSIDAIDVTAVDTTGAGDVFNGVLAACIAEKTDIETACKYAVTASGISVSGKYVLNSIPYRHEIERRLYNE